MITNGFDQKTRKDLASAVAKLESINSGISAMSGQLSAITGNGDIVADLQQGTIDAISATSLFVDQVEGLLSTLNANTDNIESILTSLGINTDQIEEMLESVGIKVGLTNESIGLIGDMPFSGAGNASVISTLKGIYSKSSVENGGHLESIDAKTPVLGVNVSARSQPVVLASDSFAPVGTTTSFNPMPISGIDNLGKKQHLPISNLPGGQFALKTIDSKDVGRSKVSYMMTAQTLTSATETLVPMIGYKDNLAVAATKTPSVVSAGKTWRVTRITITYVATATVGSVIVNLRANINGLAAISSPIVESWQVGQITVGAGTSQTVVITFPDGIEFAEGTGVGITIQGVASAGGVGVTGYAKVTIGGFEY